ncbi:MAG: hypothetical protein KDK89_15810 [Alphaproteobacteria bacterium]|nr:hypothetical protein [Alphaproteobacteria bacterium]
MIEETDMPVPEIMKQDGMSVVRNHLFPIGTKARHMPVLIEDAKVGVRASDGKATCPQDRSRWHRAQHHSHHSQEQ